MNRFQLSLLVLLLVAGTASAHRRGFVHTYEYQTLPKGDTELEWWNTQIHDGESDAFQMQIEFEHGLTDHWDVAIYHVLEQVDDESLHFTKTKLETRYRLGERGEKLLDTLLYFEVAKAFGEKKWEFEPKLILAKDFGASTVALNLIPEIELEEEMEPNGETELEMEFEPGWALGWSFEKSPRLRFGAEYFGHVEDPGDTGEVSAWAGPTISFAPASEIWLTTTAAFGLNDRSEDFNLRFILGIGL